MCSSVSHCYPWPLNTGSGRDLSSGLAIAKLHYRRISWSYCKSRKGVGEIKWCYIRLEYFQHTKLKVSVCWWSFFSDVVSCYITSPLHQYAHQKHVSFTLIPQLWWNIQMQTRKDYINNQNKPYWCAFSFLFFKNFLTGSTCVDHTFDSLQNIFRSLPSQAKTAECFLILWAGTHVLSKWLISPYLSRITSRPPCLPLPSSLICFLF